MCCDYRACAWQECVENISLLYLSQVHQFGPLYASLDQLRIFNSGGINDLGMVQTEVVILAYIGQCWSVGTLRLRFCVIELMPVRRIYITMC